MPDVHQGRWSAQIEGDFVVFLIGARLNLLRPIRGLRDLGGRRGMLHMLKELSADPESGLLGYQNLGPGILVQYWRSFEHLEAFANDADRSHVPAWRKYWKRVGTDPRTGIWHETYLVRAGEYEAVYGNMPPHGLGRAGELVPIAEDSTARKRLRRATRAAG